MMRTSCLFFMLAVYFPLNVWSQYYKDLTTDIVQTPASFNTGVNDIQSAFNNGRTMENQQLGTNLPQLAFPSSWSSLNVQQRATWIINNERIGRGLKEFTGTDTNVISIAQYYADYLLKNDKFGHNEDGLTPSTRLNKNATIAGCREATYASENLYVMASSSTTDIPYELEYALYNWLYADGGSAWGHRRCLLQNAFNDNSGLTGEEGLFGIGVASGGPYKGNFSQPWNHAELVVFEVIDPCAAWKYDHPAAIAETKQNDDCRIYFDGNNIQLLTPFASGKMIIEVYTSLGMKVYEKHCIQGNTTLSCTYSPGVYLVRIVMENYCYSGKVWVE